MRSLPMVTTRPMSVRADRLAPPRLWAAFRIVGVLCCVGVSLATLRSPAIGLMLFWQAVMLPLPLVLLVAPGLWRNVCPMATLNSLPGRLGWSRGRRVPVRVQRIAPAISAGLFCAVVPLRKVILDENGTASAALIFLLLTVALVAGFLFGGKGGWCSHFCPMGSAERLYGHSPLLVIRDTHCKPCVGCARQCYDLGPTRVNLAEGLSGDRCIRLARLAFAGAMPWLCVAFFTQPSLTQPSAELVVFLVGRMWLFATIGAGVGLTLLRSSVVSYHQLIRIHSVVALNLYYLFALSARWSLPGHLLLVLPFGVALVSGVWLCVAAWRERVFFTVRFLGAMRAARRSPATADV